jgi:hypothetical protein
MAQDKPASWAAMLALARTMVHIGEKYEDDKLKAQGLELEKEAEAAVAASHPKPENPDTKH